MPSPRATDQHHNQLNHSERERERREDGRGIRSENQRARLNLQTERERGSGGRNVICKRPLSKPCPLPTPLQGIDLVCMPFPPLWLLHPPREKETRQECQPPRAFDIDDEGCDYDFKMLLKQPSSRITCTR